MHDRNVALLVRLDSLALVTGVGVVNPAEGLTLTLTLSLTLSLSLTLTLTRTLTLTLTRSTQRRASTAL